MNKYAIIVAAGSGTRMQHTTPKAFLPIHNRPVLWYTLRTFLEAYEDLQVVLVLPSTHIELGTQLFCTNEPAWANRIQIIEGGATRFHSVQRGIRHIYNDKTFSSSSSPSSPSPSSSPSSSDTILFIHDGVRCLLTPTLIHRCYNTALDKGSAIPAIDAVDSVRIHTPEGYMPLDRGKLKLIQTPQTFRGEIIAKAYEQEYEEGFTDDASVVEKMGGKVYLVEGEVDNIKVTYRRDLWLAGEIIGGRDY